MSELSNRKRKYIRRMAGKASAEAIARDIALPLDTVRELIREYTGKDARANASESFRASYAMLLLVIVLAPLAVNNVGYDYADLPKRAILQVGLLVIAGLWLGEGAVRRGLSIERTPIYGPLLALFCLIVLSAAFASNSIRAFTQVLHWLLCILAFTLTFQLLGRRGRSHSLLTAVVAGVCLIAGIGVLQYLFAFDWVRQSISPASTFVNRNFASQFVAMGFPLALVVLFTSPGQRRQWTAGFCVFLSITFLGYTITRASILAVAVEIVVIGALLGYLIIIRKRPLDLDRKRAIIFSLAVVAGLACANLEPLGGQAAEASTREGESESVVERISAKGTGTLAIRLYFYRNTLEMIRQHPIIGVGADNFRIHYPATQITGKRDPNVTLGKKPRTSHNDYLQFVAEHGVASIFLLIWVCGIILVHGRRLITQSTEKTQLLTGIGTFASVVGLGINALFSAAVYRAIPPFTLAIVLACFFRLPQPSVSDSSSKSDLSVVRKILNRNLLLSVSLFFLILAGSWGWMQYRWIRADIYRNQFMYFATKEPKWDRVLKLWPKVIQYNPFRLDNYKFVAVAEMYRDRNREAVAICEEYRKRFPHDPMNLYNLTLCYLRLEEFAKAAPVIQHLAAMMPDDPDVQRQLGKVERGLRRELKDQKIVNRVR